ncbi:asparaginase [Candidatus Uhrbacteria bacterium]|nr:asparaginase [Candidatus Uhrbacteria bacterium]
MNNKILLVVASESDLGRDELKSTSGSTLAQIKEIKLISDFDVKFVFNGQGRQAWQPLLAEIHEELNHYSGIVVYCDYSRVLLLSNIVSFVFQNLPKTVIFTGAKSQDSKDLAELKSNLINAFQVAKMNIYEVALVFGNRVLRPAQAFFNPDSQLNLFSASPDGIIGKIDFGFSPVKIKSQPSGILEFRPEINDQINCINFYPFANLSLLKKTEVDGFLIKDGFLDQQAVENLHEFRQKVILFKTEGHQDCSRCISTTGQIIEAALAKFMWSLGQTRDEKGFRKLFLNNLVGEWGV